MCDLAAMREAISKNPEAFVCYEEALARQVKMNEKTLVAVNAECDVLIERLRGARWKN